MIVLKKATGRLWLWLWLFLTFVQWSRQFLGESFRPQAGTASARFFQFPEIVVLEICFVTGLLVLTYLVGRKQRWIVICACVATLAIALYHRDTYSIGVDLLLIVSVAQVMFAYLRPERLT